MPIVGGSGIKQLENPFLLFVEGKQSLLQDRTELRPEAQVLFLVLLLQGFEGLQHLLYEVFPNRQNLAVLLEHFPGHIQGKVFGIHHSLDEAQVLGHQVATLVHDEDPPHVELYAAMGHFPVIEIHGRTRGQVQQRTGFKIALHGRGQVQQWILVIVGDVAVELFVFLVADVRSRAGPDRLHGIQRLFSFHRLGEVVALFLLHHRQPNRVRNEIREAGHDLPQDPFVGVIRNAVVGIDGLEVHGDGGTGGLALARLQGVFATAIGFPERGVVFTRPSAENRDLVRDHEARVEAHPELSDQIGRGVVRFFDISKKFQSARARDGAQVFHQFVPGHPDPIVIENQGACLGIRRDADSQFLVGQQLGLGQSLKAQAVQSIRGIGNQLPEENIFVGVERVDHQVE